MERVEALVIGAGVVGLAVAARLCKRFPETVVVERHESFGRETSSRNSEVIHAGLYYQASLLKTTLCTRGNPLLYQLCRERGIPHRRCGKLVVATRSEELPELEAVHRQALANGVPEVRPLDGREIAELEPQAAGIAGLYSAGSGIVDSHSLMKALETEALAGGATMAYGCEALGLTARGGEWSVLIRDADGEELTVGSPVVVNAAGLQCDRIAAMAGIDVEASGYRLHPCKGEYFRVADRHRGRLSHLVYPVPSPSHLGAHAVLGLDGGLKMGPSSFYVDRNDYSVDPAHGAELYEKAHRFLPFLEPEDLTPDMSGIRPKLQKPGEPMRDFIIREESDRGCPGLIDLVGIESPGLTACLAIAERVEALLL